MSPERESALEALFQFCYHELNTMDGDSHAVISWKDAAELERLCDAVESTES